MHIRATPNVLGPTARIALSGCRVSGMQALQIPGTDHMVLAVKPMLAYLIKLLWRCLNCLALTPHVEGAVALDAGQKLAADRDSATAAAAALCIAGGADIIRVHNVAMGRDAARTADAICSAVSAFSPNKLSVSL